MAENARARARPQGTAGQTMSGMTPTSSPIVATTQWTSTASIVVGKAQADSDDGEEVEMERLMDEETGELKFKEHRSPPMRAAVADASIVLKGAMQSDAASDQPRLCGVPMKWVSLLALTLQTSAQALLIKWSKSHAKDAAFVPYLSTTAVFCTEVVKVFASLALLTLEAGSVSGTIEILQQNFRQGKVDLLKACVPSLIYTFQNNLMFYSLEKLSAPVQQVLYQMKVVTTTGIGVIMLGKTLTAAQWIACFLLASGVALVQWPREGTGFDGFDSEELKGFAAVFTACCTSGFAGVWIQKMLQQSTASIWMRNVQLALFGSAMSLMVAFANNAEAIERDGFFQGYNERVLAVILMTAFGGLLCAVMLKYAGATHGCFSTALSIILTSLLSQSLLADFSPDTMFLVGTSVAVSASLLFALGPPEFVSRIFKQMCG
mmetsp:Transcript_51661/g.146302  ORF Transcript_51661/g.146302 Transcript_51661/m.146302 type:complete len:434 (+) Transcript_51661:3-1304(+)